jgi:hypothetical protein
MSTNDQVIKSILEGNDDSSQSNGGDGADASASDANSSSASLVTMPDGRQVTPEQAVDEYKKLQSDYTRKSQELSDLQKGSNTATAPDEKRLEQIKKELKSLGVKFQEDDAVQEARITQQLQLKQRMDSLATSIDGTDGRPAFKPQEIIAWMQKNNFFTADVEKVYEMIYSNELAKWRAEQVLEAQKANDVPGARGTGLRTELPTGGEEKRQAKNMNRATREELRAKIRGALTHNS